MSKTKEELQKELDKLVNLEQQVETKRFALEYKDLPCPFRIGKKYFLRTVTYFATGEVTAIVGNWLVLKDGAWIADTGRFRDAIMKGMLSEVEPVDVPMYVNMNSITDAFDWIHDLPRKQK